MDIIKNLIDRRFLVLAFIAVLLMVVLSACSTSAVTAPDPNASAAVVDDSSADSSTESTPPPVNNLIKNFGEVVTYDSGLSISLSEPIPFTPGEYAAGVVEGQTPLVFKVVLTNNTSDAIDPYTFVSVSSAGAESSTISDVQNPEYGDIGLPPTTKVLPGQTVEWYVGFSVADPSTITADVQTALELESAVFTNIPL